MPRGYDEYLLDSLCQPNSGDEHEVVVNEATPARRPSLAESLPRIPIRIEGCGICITLKAGPHVRWTKLLSKWSSCFADSGTAPMAWPVTVRLGGSDESIPLTSIQESISKSIGPDNLTRVSEEDPALVVTVGQQKVEEEDVIGPPPSECILPPPPPVKQAEAEKPDQIKVMITSSFGQEGKKRKLKLNVSSNCLVSRLIRKWIEALKSEDKIEPDTIELCLGNGVALDRSKVLSEALSGDVSEDGRYQVEAKLQVKKTMSSSPKRRRDATSQEVELMYWKQMKTAEAEGIGAELLAEEEKSSGSFVDDEEALAIALSLSEET